MLRVTDFNKIWGGVKIYKGTERVEIFFVLFYFIRTIYFMNIIIINKLFFIILKIY